MGDAADDARDAELTWYFDELFRKRTKIVHRIRRARLDGIAKGWWRTRTDVEMPITTMKDDHLANTIEMLRRNNLTDTMKFKELTDEQASRNP